MTTRLCRPLYQFCFHTRQGFTPEYLTLLPSTCTIHITATHSIIADMATRVCLKTGKQTGVVTEMMRLQSHALLRLRMQLLRSLVLDIRWVEQHL